jgi:DNA segregation ATPase FtsK/SpoIIIE-like protein
MDNLKENPKLRLCCGVEKKQDEDFKLLKEFFNGVRMELTPGIATAAEKLIDKQALSAGILGMVVYVEYHGKKYAIYKEARPDLSAVKERRDFSEYISRLEGVVKRLETAKAPADPAEVQAVPPPIRGKGPGGRYRGPAEKKNAEPLPQLDIFSDKTPEQTRAERINQDAHNAGQL